MAQIKQGDVIRYLQGRVLCVQVGTVARVGVGGIELYCGTWIESGEILGVVGHTPDEMPLPSRISTAMQAGVGYMQKSYHPRPNKRAEYEDENEGGGPTGERTA